MRLGLKRFVLLAGCGALAGSLAAAANTQEIPQGGDPREGHRLAVKICGACHVAAPDQQFPPILRPSAPSFHAIANRPGVSAESLRTFLLTTHSTIATPRNMPNPQLTDDQATAVVSYILSLRDRR